MAAERQPGVTTETELACIARDAQAGLDVRAAVRNDTLEDAFRRRYPSFRPANDDRRPITEAARPVRMIWHVLPRLAAVDLTDYLARRSIIPLTALICGAAFTLNCKPV